MKIFPLFNLNPVRVINSDGHIYKAALFKLQHNEDTCFTHIDFHLLDIMDKRNKLMDRILRHTIHNKLKKLLAPPD